MATMSITRQMIISKEDVKKIQASNPTPLLQEVYASVDAKRHKVNFPKNWVEKQIKLPPIYGRACEEAGFRSNKP